MNGTPKKQTRVMLDVDMFFNRDDFNDLDSKGLNLLVSEKSFAKRKKDQISQAVEKWAYVTGQAGFALSDYLIMPDPNEGQIYIKYDLELLFWTSDFPELTEMGNVDSFARRKRDQILQAVEKWQYVTGHSSLCIAIIGGIVQHDNCDDEFYISDEQVNCSGDHHNVDDLVLNDIDSENVAEVRPVRQPARLVTATEDDSDG